MDSDAGTGTKTRDGFALSVVIDSYTIPNY